jgi:hypothetical protein
VRARSLLAASVIATALACPAPPAPTPSTPTPSTPTPAPSTPSTPTPPTPKPPTVTAGQPKLQGGVDALDAVQVASRAAPSLLACATAGLTGSVTLRLVLKGDGTVAKATSTSTSLPSAATDCAVGLARTWQYAKPRGGIAVVEQPFVFAP